MIYFAADRLRTMRTTQMMNVSRRPGRVRLRSSTSQLPEDTPSWGIPCAKMRRIMWYLIWCIVIATILSLNNLVLLYIQHSKSAQMDTNEKMPTTEERILHGTIRKTFAQPDDDIFHTTQQAVIEEDIPKKLATRKPVQKKPLQPAPSKVKPTQQPKVKVKDPPPSVTERIMSETSGTTPNELLKESAIVVINSKSACQLNQVISNFKQDYADIPVYIEKSMAVASLCDNKNKKIYCISPPSECKHSCVYNHLIKQVDGKEYPYIFVWDASFFYTESHALALLAKRFVESRAKILSPCICGFCNSTTGTLHTSRLTGELTAIPGIYLPSNLSVNSPTCHQSDLLPPVFLASRDTLMNHQLWDDSLSSGQHTDFLLRVKREKLAVAACKDIEITFNSSCTEEKTSYSFSDDWLYMSTKSFKKWNITKVFNGLGNSYQPSYDNTTHVDRKWKPIDLSAAEKTVDHYLQRAVIQNINDQSPGWKNVRSKPANTSKLMYMYTSPCIMRIQGSLHVDYDRHSSFKNEESDIEVDLHHLNRSCHMFQDYWKLQKYGKLKRKQVYFVTAVGNDTEFMVRLLLMINAQHDKSFTNLVIVDMSRPGPEQFNLTKHRKSLNIPVHYLHLGAPFSRSIGLKKGFDFAQQLAKSQAQENPILFSVDTSMVIPTDFTRRVWKSTRCGFSTYAPICFKEKTEDSGYWVKAGYGMVGVCASDYNKAGGWDSKWGYHWGAEDVDFINRMKQHVPYIVRVKEEKYKHVHSGENRKNAKEYYASRNLYDRQLPVTPVTKLVTDNDLKQSLYNYAVKRMKYSSVNLLLKEAYVTTLPQTSGVLYDLKFSNNINEEYYALIQSV